MCLIDVREPHETSAGTIAGALLIPLGALPERIPTLNLSREIVTVCQCGERSAYAARQLTEAGAARVQSLGGGMLAWHAATVTR